MKLSDRHELALSIQKGFTKFSTSGYSTANWLAVADHVLNDVGEADAKKRADLEAAMKKLQDVAFIAGIRDKVKSDLGEVEYRRIAEPLVAKLIRTAADNKRTPEELTLDTLRMLHALNIDPLLAAPILCALADARELK